MTTPDNGQQPTPANRRWTRWLTPVLALVAAAVIGLFGGILIGQHSGQSSQAAGFNRPGQGGFGQRGGQGTNGQQGGAGNLAGFAAGTIVSVSGSSIVIKKQDGTQITVSTSDSTNVVTTAKSAVKNLKAGETITVRGQVDSNGNVAATSVSEGSGLFGGGALRQSQQPGAGN